MAEQSFDISFDGYWRDEKKGSVPASSGIYCVYSCVYDKSKKTVDLKKLIYIGQSADVKKRLANHDKYDAWKKHVVAQGELCFTFALVTSQNLDRCEAAMIFKHKPVENSDYLNSFPFDRTTISLKGKIEFLEPTYTLDRK
jgi:excinuclease UvrABC nuclease subunit